MPLFIQFIHVLCGVTFFGIAVGSFVYLHLSMRQNDPVLMHYALKVSLIGDVFVLPMIFIQFITGTFLIYHHQIPMSTPWIIVAYHAFGVVTLIWLSLAFIKYRNFSRQLSSFRFKKTFYGLSIVMIILFCIIVHDAVTQSTWFWSVK